MAHALVHGPQLPLVVEINNFIFLGCYQVNLPTGHHLEYCLYIGFVDSLLGSTEVWNCTYDLVHNSQSILRVVTYLVSTFPVTQDTIPCFLRRPSMARNSPYDLYVSLHRSFCVDFCTLLLFGFVLIRLMYNYILLISGTMASRSKKDEIRAMQTQLRDEPSDTEVSPQASRSVKQLNVNPDEGVERRHSRADSRQLVLAQTQAIVDRPPQSEEGGAQQGNPNQMTNSYDRSRLG